MHFLNIVESEHYSGDSTWLSTLHAAPWAIVATPINANWRRILPESLRPFRLLSDPLELLHKRPSPETAVKLQSADSLTEPKKVKGPARTLCCFEHKRSSVRSDGLVLRHP